MAHKNKIRHTSWASIILERGEGFERVGIASHSGEALVPKPTSSIDRTVNTRDSRLRSHACHVLGLQLLKNLGGSSTNDQDIAESENDLLMSSTGLQVLHSDASAVKGAKGDSLLLGVGLIVNENTSSDKATTLVPVLKGWGHILVSWVSQRLLGGLVAVVGQAGVWMSEMAETVPLAAGLGVEGELIIPGVGTEGLAKVVDGMLSWLAAWDSKLDNEKALSVICHFLQTGGDHDCLERESLQVTIPFRTLFMASRLQLVDKSLAKHHPVKISSVILT